MKKTFVGLLVVATISIVGMPLATAETQTQDSSPAVEVMAAPPAQDPFCGFVDTGWDSYFSVASCWLKERGITSGTAPEFYGPDGQVTRGQMAAFLWRKAGSPVVANHVFADEAQIPSWARQGADWLRVQGITTIDPYRPNDPVTRGEMAAFLWRAAGKPTAPSSCGLTDAASIPSWARQGACWLKANNITNNNPYNPAGRVTRGQMAAFLWREAGRQSISMPSASALVLWVNTAKGDRNVDLPLGAGNVTIDWGDGTAAETTAGSQVVRHTYATNGYYRIVITGTLAEFGGYDNANNYDLPELVAVPQFGNIGITSLGYSFTKAPNLARVSRNLPGVVDNLEGAFSTAVKANPCNPGAADWPQCLLNAQTASAENNYKRLYEYLGEDISQWDTSQIEDFSWMFAFEGEFNEDISGWDTSSATNMASMFLGAEAFNQDISGWDVSNVTNMQQMFENADAFNQDISGWDVSNVTNMLGMFTFTVAFQSDLSTWNISNVETFEMMFAHSPYNGSLAGWSFGQGTSLEAMFLGSTFNGDISSWDVSGVTSIKNMFQDATAFNQDLSSWQISGSSDRSNYDGGATSWVLPRPSIV